MCGLMRALVAALIVDLVGKQRSDGWIVGLMDGLMGELMYKLLDGCGA